MRRPWSELALVGLAASAAAAVWWAAPTPYLAPELQTATRLLGLSWVLRCGWRLDRALAKRRAWTSAEDWHLALADLPAAAQTWWQWLRGHHPDGLFLGRAFRWQGSHTQELETALLTEKALPVAETVRGGHPALHAVGQRRERPLILPWSEGVMHTLLEGMTRAGKSELFHVLINQVIPRPGVTVIIEPKGKRDTLAYAALAAQRAGKKFLLISPACAEQSATINVLGTAKSPAEVAMRIRALTPGGGKEVKYSFFTETAMTVIEHVASAQQALGMPWTLEGLYQASSMRQHMRTLLLDYLDHRGYSGTNITDVIKRYQQGGPSDLIADALIEMWQHDADHFRQITATLIPTFEGVVGDPLGRLFSSIPGDVVWQDIARDGVVVYVALASMLLRETANRIGRIILQDLVGYLGQVYAYTDATTYVPMTICVDEVREVLYPEFLTVLAMSGEAQVRWILAQQSQADPELVLGRAAAEVYHTNLGTKLTFRLGHDATAKARAEGLGTCRIQLADDGAGIGYGGVGGLTGSRHRRLAWQAVPLVRPEWFKALPRGEYVARMKGEIFKGRVPLLERVTEAQIEALGLRKLWDALAPQNDTEEEEACDEMTG